MPPRVAQGSSRGGGGRGAGRGGAGAPPGRGGRGGGRGGFNGGGGTQGAPVISDHVTTVGVRRPNFGTMGKTTTIAVNSFVTTIPQSIIRHYDGE
ncbi:hypothetical protein PM082_009940 [Marasmius tenuissimus]|nr:hypothetical protein PM082_009940 [Marasmius tenuissimus]